MALWKNPRKKNALYKPFVKCIIFSWIFLNVDQCDTQFRYTVNHTGDGATNIVGQVGACLHNGETCYR